MKGVTLEVKEQVRTETHEEIEVLCECSERSNGRITLTIPKYEETPAKHLTLTDNEFDQVAAVVEDFRKKRGAIASTYTKEN